MGLHAIEQWFTRCQSQQSRPLSRTTEPSLDLRQINASMHMRSIFDHQLSRSVAFTMAPSRAIRAVHKVCAGGIQRSHGVGRRNYTATASLMSIEDRAPRIASPSFWTSLVPRFLRRPTSEEEAAERARRRDAGAEERRIGITFLVLGLVVGSNAINIIGLRREMLNFSRQTDAKLDVLRGVISRVRNGEEFDVKKALGTGDPEQEKEWEQVIEELENTDMLLEGRKKREAKRAEKAEERRLKDEERSRAASADAGESTRKPAPKFLM